MNMREVRLLLWVVALGLALAFVVAPRTQGQRGKRRHTCRQDCASKYQECLDKEGADDAECEKAFGGCRAECVGSRDKPESERAANANRGRAAEKAEANANADGDPGGNVNGNSNVNGNVNGGRNRPSGGSGSPPPPPKKSGAKPPSSQP